MKDGTIVIDKGKTAEEIKPLHAVGGGPRQGGARLGYDFTKEFSEIGVPYARLHDIEGEYAKNQFVDIHCVFPDFDADVNDPAAYNFEPTDAYINAIHACGGKAFYRLGETIDHFERKLYVRAPKDFLKWAQICEHIILHYNHGWNNGFELGIEYWEIWNEPDNPRMWTDTKEEFFELYVVTATYLKEKFPNIKIGGYAVSGFYAFNRADASPWFKTLVPYLTEFFEYLKKQPKKVPLDFLSWHCYSESPEEVVLHSRYAEEFLQKYGYEEAENILDEYNTRDSLSICPSVIPYYAAEIGATLIAAQDSPIDMLIYYDCRLHLMNGIFQLEGDYKTPRRLHAFYAMRAFGDLYRLKTRCSCEGMPKGVYALAATDGEKTGVMLAVKDYEGELEISVSNGGGKGYRLMQSTYEQFEKNSEGALDGNGAVQLCVQKDSVYYIEIEG